MQNNISNDISIQFAWLESNCIFDKDANSPIIKKKHTRKLKKKAKKAIQKEIVADSRIDLHGYSLEEALCNVKLELELAQKNNWKSILIVHGIGEKSGGVIRKVLEQKFRSEWSVFVKEYHSEKNNRGSSLAILV